MKRWQWVGAVVLFSTIAHASELYLKARPGYAWSFPRDHWARTAYKNEWWYFTGHLETDEHPPRRFGYQFTLFRFGITPESAGKDSAWNSRQMILGHAAITDVSAQHHWFSDVLHRETPFLAGIGKSPDSRLAWIVGPAGTEAPWVLKWNGQAFDLKASDDAQQFSFDLSTTPKKPLIFEGPGGFSRKTADGSEGSEYYSFTRLRTEGMLRIGTTTVHVEGDSWMDKEFGSEQLGSKQSGWDWFSFQFSDGTEAMLYLLRQPNGTIDFASGTLVDRTARVRYLSQAEIHVRASASWTSPQSGITYPSRWTITLRNQTFDVRPIVADQENRGQAMKNITYWEGAVDLIATDEKQIGRGYVELTGYSGGDGR